MPGAVFASSSRDCTVRIWKLVDNKEWGLLNLLNPHKQLADRLGIASCHYIPAGVPNFPNSAIVTTAYDHTAVVQHPETSEIYHRLQGHSDAVVCATHTPLGDIVTGSADQCVSQSFPSLFRSSLGLLLTQYAFICTLFTLVPLLFGEMVQYISA